MGSPTSSSDARSLRDELVGHTRAEQQVIAYRWALTNDKIIDMFGAFAHDRKLCVFRSGNEFENWIDPMLNVLYKMNILTHVGGDIAKLLERIDAYNQLFPSTALRFVGFHAMSTSNVYPVFVQPFVPNARFATNEEIRQYMIKIGFTQEAEGVYTNEIYRLSDILPKNVLYMEGDIYVIDAEIIRR